jgi:hypothetical protein
MRRRSNTAFEYHKGNHCLFVTIVVTFTMTRPIPVQHRARKLPPIHRVTNASFCKSLRITHMQTAWGYRPSFSTNCSNGIARINQKARLRDRRLSEPSEEKRRARRYHDSEATTTLRRREYKSMPLWKIASSPSHRFLFWTSRRTALYIRLLLGCRCLLHGFAHTTSGLAAVFTASGTFSGVNSSGAGSTWSPCNKTDAGCTCSPPNVYLNFTALGFCGANSTNEG